MTVLVGLNIVIAAILGFTATLCVGASIGMRNNAPMAWLSVAMGCGSIQALVTTLDGGQMFEVLTAAVFAPLGFLCAGQAIRAMSAHASQGPVVVSAVAALSGLALILAALDVPFFYQSLAIQAGCTIAMTDATIQMARQTERRAFDIVLMLGLVLVMLTCAARVPVIIFLFGTDATFTEIRHSGFQILVMSVTGLLVPPVIFLLLAKNIGEVIATYQRQSEHDGLTGLLNRRTFDAVAENSLVAGGAVIFCDIDNFKQINDRFGHEAGDDVIRTMAALLSQADYPAGRIGGEEFALLLPGQGIDSAVVLANLIRARFTDTAHLSLSPDQRLSASFGIALCIAGESPRAAFRRADVALYRAKEAGRDRVATFSPAKDIEALATSRQAA